MDYRSLGLGIFTGVSVGLLVLYLFKEKPKIVFDYINFKKEDEVYQDNAGVCYVHKKENIECPSTGTIKESDLLQ